MGNSQPVWVGIALNSDRFRQLFFSGCDIININSYLNATGAGPGDVPGRRFFLPGSLTAKGVSDGFYYR